MNQEHKDQVKPRYLHLVNLYSKEMAESKYHNLKRSLMLNIVTF